MHWKMELLQEQQQKNFRYQKQLFEEHLKTKTNMPKTIQKVLVTTR